MIVDLNQVILQINNLQACAHMNHIVDLFLVLLQPSCLVPCSKPNPILHVLSLLVKPRRPTSSSQHHLQYFFLAHVQFSVIPLTHRTSLN